VLPPSREEAGDGVPVIALTLRHDRLDNFWFTLLHEFAHVACHLSPDRQVILDDLDVASSDAIELVCTERSYPSFNLEADRQG
jgi:Zn-dependent peptidase ImmA (M78 family)